jgi:thiamine-phosphate pyrophosphorylase
MTDPRLGGGLLAAVQKLPYGSGVIFRHYQLAEQERHLLFRQIRRICKRRGHKLLLAGPDALARRWYADGFHRRATGNAGLHSAPVHSAREIADARRAGAQILFLSPLHTTRSHPGSRPLGLTRFMALAGLAYPSKVIALGGMTRNRAHALDKRLVHGWAAIEAFKK